MVDEIESIFIDNKQIFDNQYLNKLKQLKFCKNVIKESLRITSIISWTSRVCPNNDLILNTKNKTKNKQVKIPKNTPIIICLGAINTEKEKWNNNPFIFNPHRFNDDNNNPNIFGNKLGNRLCPGKLLFETQTLIFMINILNKFKLICKESKIQPKYQLLTKPNKTININICKRKFAMI